MPREELTLLLTVVAVYPVEPTGTGAPERVLHTEQVGAAGPASELIRSPTSRGAAGVEPGLLASCSKERNLFLQTVSNEQVSSKTRTDYKKRPEFMKRDSERGQTT